MEENKDLLENKVQDDTTNNQNISSVDSVDNTGSDKFEINNNISKETINESDEKKIDNSSTMKNMQSPKITPSYQNNVKNSKEKNKVKKDRHISKIWFILLAILVIAIPGIIWIISELSIDYTPYESYFNTMDIYGFNTIYDNESAKMSEKVNYAEAVKLILSTVLQIDDLPKYIQEEESYKDENWIEFAQSLEFVSNSEEMQKEYSKHISYIDCISLLAKAKSSLLEEELTTSVTPNFSDFDEYTNEEQIAIKDMVANKIIDNSSEKLNAKKDVRKAYLNQMIVNFVRQYNLITVNGAKLNINPEKSPSNEESYPYILSNVSKNVYEMSFYIKNPDKFISPKNLFKDQRKNYKVIDEKVSSYFDTILNVDYEKINAEMFNLLLEESLLYKPDMRKLNDYIEYVKKNKIKMSGEANVIFPVVYYDGEDYRVRVKVTYKLESSDDLTNVVYLDDNSKKTYEIGEHSMYLEVPLQEMSQNMFIKPGNINNWGTGKMKE